MHTMTHEDPHNTTQGVYVSMMYTYHINGYQVQQHCSDTVCSTSFSVTISYIINGNTYMHSFIPRAMCILQPDIFGHTHLYILIPEQHTVWHLIPSQPLLSPTRPYPQWWQPVETHTTETETLSLNVWPLVTINTCTTHLV